MEIPVKNNPVKRTARRAARAILESISGLRPRHWEALGLRLSQDFRAVTSSAATLENLARAIGWLKLAQDVTGGGGVSWGYCTRTPFRSAHTYGWRPAYPETTGYIIETLLRYGHLTGDADCRDRARAMADWELSIQRNDGGIQGGMIGAPVVESSTFVTGQVIFGWVRAFEEFGRLDCLDAARRAGDFLLSCLDDSGRFVAGYSHFCAPGPKAYEARTGWALAELGRISGDNKYTRAAKKIGEFAVSCQYSNGWFDQNDLDHHDVPLTHTLGYVLEGLLETALILKDPCLVESVRFTLQQLQNLVKENGFLAGRWTNNWEPAVGSCCLSGSSQLACVYFRMHRLDPNSGFFDTGRKLLGYVTATQLDAHSNSALIGGIFGSFPLNGGYGNYSILNWATKFYADAVMDYFALLNANRRGPNDVGQFARPAETGQRSPELELQRIVEATPATRAVNFVAVAEALEQHCRDLEVLNPANPFQTYAYLEARRSLGYQPFVFGLRRGTRWVEGCTGFLKSGRLTRNLEIPSAPALPADSEVFWSGVLQFCRDHRVTTLEVNSFSSSAVHIPRLPGEIRRGLRWEFVLQLENADLMKRMHKNHRWSVRRAHNAALQVRRTNDLRACEDHATLGDASMDRRRGRGEDVPVGASPATAAALVKAGAGELFQTLKDHRVISSLLVLKSEECLYAHSAGTAEEGRNCGAAHLLWFEVAKTGQQESRKCFNLGGSSQIESGLSRFKSDFGAAPVQLESAEFLVGSPVRKRIASAVGLLRSDPVEFMRQVRGRFQRWIVYGADIVELQPPVARAEVVFKKLSGEELDHLPPHLKELQQEQLDRVSQLGSNTAYAVFLNNSLAHISWLITRDQETRVPPRMLKLQEHEAEITACVTLPEFRGRGLYPFAIRSICWEAKRQGINRVLMKTKVDNLSSQRGILKTGLTRCGHVFCYRAPYLLAFNEIVLRTFRWGL